MSTDTKKRSKSNKQNTTQKQKPQPNQLVAHKSTNSNNNTNANHKTSKRILKEVPLNRQFQTKRFLALSSPLILPLFFFFLYAGETSYYVKLQICMSTAVSFIALLLAWKLIPQLHGYLLTADLFGKDLNKAGLAENKPPVPESLGVVVGSVYVVSIIFSQLIYTFHATKPLLIEYNAALHSISFMIFLGFVDDVVDLPWRYKLILPSVASLPLLLAYTGGTSVVVPRFLRPFLSQFVDLGILYKVYMGLLAVFCTNAINIYAGVNGLEAGQSLVIACSILAHNIIELHGPIPENHLFSIVLILPFIFVTIALLNYNWYPSQVFVGDCFTYFAGMTFAVVGILGHFSKTLMLFFIPQVLNFLISLPQLFGFIPCPRHRLPKLNEATGKLEGVSNHWNLVNVVLMIAGPMKEDTLVIVLLVFQVICCSLAFFIRYYVASYFYH